MYHKL